MLLRLKVSPSPLGMQSCLSAFNLWSSVSCMFAEEVEEHTLLELDATVGGVSLLMCSTRVDMCCLGSEDVAVGRMQAVDCVGKGADREAHVVEER